jgi:hypothetical protein
MKKVLLVLVAVMGFAFAASAQDNAIGVRIGGGQGFGAEISYQRSLGNPHRLEVDLGYATGSGVGALGLSALYQLHFDINAVQNLGWYVGAGGRFMTSNYQNVNVMMLGVAAQAGMDYHFNAVPIQLSLDIRPCFYLWQATAFQWGDIALGIRYMF